MRFPGWLLLLATAACTAPPDRSRDAGQDVPPQAPPAAARQAPQAPPERPGAQPTPQDASPAYTEPIVIFVDPDTLDLARLREEYGEEDFYVVADDAMYYRSMAIRALDSLGIPHTTRERRGEAYFDVHGERRLFSWGAVEGAWFLVLYNGADEPRISQAIAFSIPDQETIDYLLRRNSR